MLILICGNIIKNTKRLPDKLKTLNTILFCCRMFYHIQEYKYFSYYRLIIILLLNKTFNMSINKCITHSH